MLCNNNNNIIFASLLIKFDCYCNYRIISAYFPHCNYLYLHHHIVSRACLCICLGDGSFSGFPRVFVCTPGINVPLEVLCDGRADCFNGDDETTPLCESELKY